MTLIRRAAKCLLLRQLPGCCASAGVLSHPDARAAVRAFAGGRCDLAARGLDRSGGGGGRMLELADHLAEDLDDGPALRGIARAPLLAARALVRDLVLH